MEIEASYLQAIQAIAGNTPGEKQKTINSIAKKIAQAKSSGGDSVDSESQILGVPELLKPLVRVEVAKILHQYEVILEAFKSEDMSIVSRALQAKWFFDGSNAKLINAKYLIENVFPEVSLFARLRIVKNLGTYLKSTAVAADFFLALTQQYGVSQAIPLLAACEEDFAFKMIVDNKIVLSLRMVESWYRKCPNVVIKYLMLSKPDDGEVRNLYRIDIRDYEDFLPEIAIDRFEDFMEIYRMHDGLDVNLGKKARRTFIKTQLHLLVEKPDKYLKLVSLKTVTQKLRLGDFKKMFKNLFPPKKDAFDYSQVISYLEYFKPEKEQTPLILNTFREVYGEDLLSCKKLIDHDLMKVLPADERIKLARLKLEDDKDWHLYDTDRSWRCYLPICESIPLITGEIAKLSDAGKRGQLLKQLIYTCKVNSDEEALLKVLNYIYDRHRNDQKYIIYNCLYLTCDCFDLAKLSSTHWEILNKFIKLAEMQEDLVSEGNTTTRLIQAALHYCTLNSLPLDDYVRDLVDIKAGLYYGSWNILTKYPDLEKKFLDMCVDVLPKQYPFENKLWKDRENILLSSLATSLWDFKGRGKCSNNKRQKLSPKNYPWLFERIRNHIYDKSDKDSYEKMIFLGQIRKYDRDFYDILIRDLENFWDFHEDVMYDVLKQQPQRVLDNWKKCLEKVEDKVKTPYGYLAPGLLRFIDKIRWYQELPIKFFEESIQNYTDPERSVGLMYILALFANGETFTKIIEPFIPNDDKIDVDHPEAKSTYTMLIAIAKNLHKVNPPVSLDVIARFCVGDYLRHTIRSLMSVCCRVPVTKVRSFAATLSDGPVSVMKHGIRLMYLVAPLEEIYTRLTDLWNSHGHTSIRQVVFTKIYHIFCKQPDSRSWRMVQTCLDNLNTNDDEKIFKSLVRLSTVPNEYLYEYIKLALKAVKAMEREADNPKPYIDISCQLIKNIDGPVTKILPEEYCQDLIKEYLFVFDYNADIFAAGKDLAIQGYLLSSKNYDESRFKFFGDFFRHSVKEHWDKPHPKCFKFHPMNFMTSKFFATICKATDDSRDVRIFESFLEIFQSALQPCQDAASYLNLVYSIAYHKSKTWAEFGKNIAEKIPELVEIFSPECVVFMSNRLSVFIKNRTFPDTESSDEKLLDIIEVFANNQVVHCALFAANMLFDNTLKTLDERHKAVIHALRNFHHPGVSWLLNARVASFDFRTDNNE